MALATQKISDKKLVAICKDLLSLTCVVSPVPEVLEAAYKSMHSIKSPIAKEEFLKWFKSFCADFGVGAVASVLGSIVGILVKVSNVLCCFWSILTTT